MNLIDLLYWHLQETAAALLQVDISLVLGVPIDGQQPWETRPPNNSLSQSKADGAEYIFLDEVSMVSCDDNYKISAQLAKALNEFDLPYGGINWYSQETCSVVTCIWIGSLQLYCGYTADATVTIR